MNIKQKNITKKFATTVTTLLAVSCLTGCTNERVENELAYRQIGLNCMESGDYAGAVGAFDNALSYCLGTIGETELDICYYKAASQYANGDVQGALETYDALISYDNKDSNAYYTRGCLHLQNGENESAIDDFSKAIEYNSEDYQLYINIYKNLSAYGLSEQGCEFLNQAFAIKGDDADALAYRGELYLLLGEYANATAELEAAIEKGSVRANVVMAQTLEAQGDGAAAETYYKAYVDSGEADAEAMNALAELEMAKPDYVTALEYVNQGLAMEQVPNKRVLMQNKIICMEYTADFTGAWQVAQEYIMLYPNDLDMQREYIFLKNRQNSVDSQMQVQAEVDTGSSTEGETTVSGSTEEEDTQSPTE